MKKIFWLFLFVCCTIVNAQAQQGCTDPQANNFDENATTNDGSCVYPTTNFSLSNVANLSNDIEENSGLAYTPFGLWTHNDATPGGDEDKLYLIDTTTGIIQKEVIIATADNVDWEDLADSDTHIFIGDFGNNSGARTDLEIHKVSKDDLNNNTFVNAEVIEFSYSDQTDFTAGNNNTDYDCEAFFYYNDSLYLFSKNWVNNQTRLYSMSASPGTHVAQYRATLDVDGLITGADISDEGVVALIGYTDLGFTFMWLLFDYEDTHFFSGNKRRIDLGSALQNSQTEGISFTENGRGYVSAEKFSIFSAKLLSFTTSQWIPSIVSSVEDLEQEKLAVKVYPNPFSQLINIEFEEFLSGDSKVQLINSIGQTVYQSTKKLQQENNIQIDLQQSDLPSGWYILHIENGNKIWNVKLIK